MTLKVEGLKELRAAMAELAEAGGSTRTGNAAHKRALMKAGQPMRQRMADYAPEQSGKLAASILISGSGKSQVGKAVFAEVKRQGGTTAAAIAARRSFQRANPGVEVHIGPSKARSGIASMIEFGVKPHVIRPRGTKGHKYVEIWKGGEIVAVSGEVRHPGAPPNPFMRNAFEATKYEALNIYVAEAKVQFDKATARARAKGAKLAAGNA